MPTFELHAHTTASDGVLSPTALVERAHGRSLRALAVTDHDTTKGIPEAQARAQALGLELIPGVEATCEGPVLGGGSMEVHILGLFVEPGSEALETAFLALRDRRFDRMHEMIALLKTVGIDVPFEAILATEPAAAEAVAAERSGAAPKRRGAFSRESLQPGGLEGVSSSRAGGREGVSSSRAGDVALGRPHLARALVARGVVASVQEAFDRYLAEGRPAFAEKLLIPAALGISSIRAARGLPVIAHPGRYGAEVDLDALAALGIGGIEVYYPKHSEADQARFLEIARRLGVVATGGADFHGDSKKAPDLGGQPMPESVLDDVRRAAGR